MADDHYELEYHRAMSAAWKAQQEAQQQQMGNHTYAIAVDGADYRLFLNLKQRLNVSSAQLFHILIRNYG